MRNIHFSLTRNDLNKPGKATFAALFALVVSARALLITVIPLQAHAMLGDAQKVSMLYFCVSIIGLCGAMTVPVLVAKLRRRWVFSAGAGAAIVASIFFAMQTLEGLIIGMVFQVFSITALEITLNLYMMEYIPRKEIGKFEPMRIFTAAGVWAVGPWLGIFLKTYFDEDAPFIGTSIAATAILTAFWYLRFNDDPIVSNMKKKPTNPIRFVGRFFSQPRLILAWFLAFGRSSWWSMFFIYAPIFVVESGMGETFSGLIVSIGISFVFLVPVWGKIGTRWGIRRLLTIGYIGAGTLAISISFMSDAPWVAIGLLISAAFAASMIDGAGNIPFLRSVHPHERPEMTAVFMTYRDFGQLAPPAVFSIVLRSFELSAVFFAGGIGMLALAGLSRSIPKRL